MLYMKFFTFICSLYNSFSLQTDEEFQQNLGLNSTGLEINIHHGYEDMEVGPEL